MTVEVSTLSVQVKSDGIKQTSDALGVLASTAKEAADATTKLESSQKKIPAKNAEVSKSTKEVTSNAQSYIRSLQQIVDTQGKSMSQTAAIIAANKKASDVEIAEANALGAKIDAYKQSKALQAEARKETEKTANAIANLIKGLEQSVDLYQANNEAIARYKAMVAGATRDEIEQAAALGRSIDQLNQRTEADKKAARASAELAVARAKANTGVGDDMVEQYRKNQASVSAFINKLQEQATTVNMNKEQLFAYQARMKGATEAQIANAAAAGRTIDAFEKVSGATQKASKNSSIFHNTLKSMIVAWTGYQIASTPLSIVQASDAWSNMAARLNIATGSMQEAKAVQVDLYNMAQKIRVPLEDTGTLFARMAQPMKAMGQTSADTIKVVESMALALKLNGATASEASGAILQFSQAIQSGRLAGAEFNTMSEQAPLVLRAIQAELQRTGELGAVTGKDLKQLGADGKLSSELIVRSMKNALPEWEAAADKLPDTFDGAMTRLKNAWLKGMGEMGQQNKLGTAIADFAKQLEDLIPTVQTGLSFLISNFNLLAMAVSAVVGLKIANWFQDAWVNAAKATIAMQANTAAIEANSVASTVAAANSARVGTGLIAVTAEAGTARTAVTLLGTAFNALGGWVGLLITGVTGLAMAWSSYSKSADGVEAASKRMRESLEKELDKIKDVNDQLRLKIALQLQGQKVPEGDLSGVDKAKASYIQLNAQLAKSIEKQKQLAANPSMYAGRYGNPALRAATVDVENLREQTLAAKNLYQGFVNEISTTGKLKSTSESLNPKVAPVVKKTPVTFEDQYSLLSKEQKTAFDNMRKNSETAGLAGKALYDYQAKEIGLTGAVKDRYVAMGLAIDRQNASKKATKEAESAEKKLETQLNSISEKTKNYADDLTNLTKANSDFNLEGELSTEWINKYSDDLEKATRKVNEATDPQLKAKWQEQVDVLEKLAYQESVRHTNVDILLPKLKAEREALASLTEEQNKYLAAKEKENNSVLSGVGIGDQARERLSRINDIKANYESQIAALTEKRDTTREAAPAAEIQRQIDLLKENYDKALTLEDDYQSKLAIRRADGWSAAKDAMQNYFDAANDSYAQFNSLTSKAFSGAEDMLTNFLQTGKMDFKSFANSIIAELARISAQRMIASLFGGATSGLSGGLFSSLNSALGLNTAVTEGGISYTAAPSGMLLSTAMGAGHAQGGGVSEGSMYRVNEQGAEMFTNAKGEDYLMVGAGGGTITSNSQLNGSNGGSTNINYSPVIQIDSRSDQAQVYSMVQAAVKQGNAELIDKLQRQRRIK